MISAAEIVALLDLRPHPEGGYFAETFRDVARGGGRGAMTAIYYLLARGQRSHWHTVDAAEIWHYYAGAPLKLSISRDGKTIEDLRLGPDLATGERPQATVPPHAWQAAESLGDWTLVGCTVGPAFEFAGFTLAPPDWRPGG